MLFVVPSNVEQRAQRRFYPWVSAVCDVDGTVPEL